MEINTKVNRILLYRRNRFEVPKYGILSEFQLDIRKWYEKNIFCIKSPEDDILKFKYTKMSGYINVKGDYEKVYVYLDPAYITFK